MDNWPANRCHSTEGNDSYKSLGDQRRLITSPPKNSPTSQSASKSEDSHSANIHPHPESTPHRLETLVLQGNTHPLCCTGPLPILSQDHLPAVSSHLAHTQQVEGSTVTWHSGAGLAWDPEPREGVHLCRALAPTLSTCFDGRGRRGLHRHAPGLQDLSSTSQGLP